MIRAAILSALILLSSPAHAARIAADDCYTDTVIPMPRRQPQPPRPPKGEPIRQAKTPAEIAAYKRWYDRWITTQPDHYWIAGRKRRDCPIEVKTTPIPWQPGWIVAFPPVDEPGDRTDPRRYDPGVPVVSASEPGAWVTLAGIAVVLIARARRAQGD